MASRKEYKSSMKELVRKTAELSFVSGLVCGFMSAELQLHDQMDNVNESAEKVGEIFLKNLDTIDELEAGSPIDRLNQELPKGFFSEILETYFSEFSAAAIAKMKEMSPEELEEAITQFLSEEFDEEDWEDDEDEDEEDWDEDDEEEDWDETDEDFIRWLTGIAESEPGPEKKEPASENGRPKLRLLRSDE